MSRAFVSEDAAAATAALLPERPVSTARNLVTPSGLALIEQQAARLQTALDECAADDPARPAIARDLRYWAARRRTAEMVPYPIAPPIAPAEVAFGTTVTFERDGASSTYRIVGEDEADPAAGLLSWTSPLAASLMGAAAGETVEIGGGRPAVRVVEVKPE